MSHQGPKRRYLSSENIKFSYSATGVSGFFTGPVKMGEMQNIHPNPQDAPTQALDVAGNVTGYTGYFRKIVTEEPIIGSVLNVTGSTLNVTGISGGAGLDTVAQGDGTLIINAGAGSGITVTDDHIHVNEDIVGTYSLMRTGFMPTGVHSSGCFGEFAIDANAQYLYVCIGGCGASGIWRRTAISEW